MLLHDAKVVVRSESEPVKAVIRRYLERKVLANAMDYDDLLLNWRRLLDQHPEVIRVRRQIQQVAQIGLRNQDEPGNGPIAMEQQMGRGQTTEPVAVGKKLRVE